MLPTTHGPGIDANADVDRNERPRIGLRFLLADKIELLDTIQHVDGGFARVELVAWIVERRIPERHDRVAHVLVDGSLAIDDRVGQRRQKAVHQRRQALRIVLVHLGDRREAADVAEHDRHRALLAAEHQLLGRLRQLGDQRWRQILAECRTNAAALRLLADVIGEDKRQIDENAGQQRIGEIDQQFFLRVVIPGRSNDQRLISAPNASKKNGLRIGAIQMIAAPISKAAHNSAPIA